MIAISLFILINHAGESVNLLLFFQLYGISLILMTTGNLILKISRMPNIPCNNLIELILGVITTSLVLNLLVILFPISATSAFLCWSIVILCSIFIFKLNVFKKIFSQENLSDYLSFFFIGSYVLLWSWKTAGSFPSIENANLLLAWIDYYIHGTEIAQFSDIKAIAHGSIALSDETLFFYHRAIFMLPALIAGISHLPGISASTAILLPFGLLLLGITIYVLGTQLSGKLTGLIAVIFIMVLPDSSLYGLKNGFFGFHYSLFVASGTAYGIAICLTSIIFYHYWICNKLTSAWFISFGLALSLMFFRVHFFILYFPMFIFLSLLQIEVIKKYQFSIMKWISILFVLFLIILFFNSDLHTIWLEQSAVLTFLKIVHLERGPTSYTEIYKHIIENYNSNIIILAGVGFMFLAAYGVWIFLYPVSLFVKYRKYGWQTIDLIPIVLVGLMIGIILFAPGAANGDFTEFQHRPFGLLYVVFIIFTLVYSMKILDNIPLPVMNYTKLIFIAIVFMGVIFTIKKPLSDRTSKLFRGSSLYQDYHIPVDGDLIKVAFYLRSHAKPGDIFLVNIDDTNDLNIDSATIISSISGLPAYIARPNLQSKQSNNVRKTIINKRVNTMNLIANTPQITKAYSLLEMSNITWYIALSQPKWDYERKFSIFNSGNIAIYLAKPTVLSKRNGIET